MGHMGLSGEREGQPKVGRAPPPPLVRIGLGEGGRRPPFLLPPHFFPPPSRSPPPTRRRTPPWRAIEVGRPPPIDPLYTGAGGTP